MSGKKTRKPKKRRPPLFYLLIIVLSIALIVGWFIITFFKVKSIEIRGEMDYAVDDVVYVAGIKLGDNALDINMKDVAKKIEKEFSNFEKVSLSHKLFGKIIINVEKAVPIAISKRSDTTYVILSDKLKVLKTNVTIMPIGMIDIKGITLIDPIEGEYAEFSDEEQSKKEMLEEIFLAIIKYDFKRINYIDITNHLDIIMHYNFEIIIKLGTKNKMDRKIELVKNQIDNEIPKGSSALVDAAPLENTDTKAYLTHRPILSIDDYYSFSGASYEDKKESLDKKENMDEDSSDIEEEDSAEKSSSDEKSD